MAVEAPEFRYDRTTIALHWAVAGLVGLQWIGGRTIDWFPKGALRIDARSVHLVVGATLAVLLVFRLYWKMRRAKRRPAERYRMVAAAIGVMHWGLLIVLGGLILLGLSLETLRGDWLFNVVKLPPIEVVESTARHQMANQLTYMHGVVANFLLILIGLHATAAITHQVILKDVVLRRML